MRVTLPRFPTGGVTFTFTGGPRDGQSVRATSPPTNKAMEHGHGLWIVTDGGTVGSQFRQSAPAYWDDDSDGQQLHKYEVTGKMERLTGVVVECLYRGGRRT